MNLETCLIHGGWGRVLAKLSMEISKLMMPFSNCTLPGNIPCVPSDIVGDNGSLSPTINWRTVVLIPNISASEAERI